jgi:protein-tyrosine phosphatase
MPPLVIDIRSAEDSRDVVHRAVQALVEGKLVAFPTETVYTVAASALNEDAVRRLSAIKDPTTPLALAVKSADEALDYAPSMSPLGERLARRCWPGPVTLMLRDRSPDSLMTQLPPQVQQALAANGSLNLRVPAHVFLLETLRLLTGPVVIVDVVGPDHNEALTAEEVLRIVDDQVQLVVDDGRSRYGQPSSLVRVGDNDFQVLQQGVVSEQTLRRLSSLMIVFVCTGNTCRSPMAEAMLRKMIADRKGIKPSELQDHGVLIASAGISAIVGGRPSPEAVAVMRRLGIDLSDHVSQPLTGHLVQRADLLIAMTKAHRNAILAEWPEAADRTRLLCRDWTDIPDPIGGPAEQYERCAEQIRAALASWIEELGL